MRKALEELAQLQVITLWVRCFKPTNNKADQREQKLGTEYKTKKEEKNCSREFIKYSLM